MVARFRQHCQRSYRERSTPWRRSHAARRVRRSRSPEIAEPPSAFQVALASADTGVDRDSRAQAEQIRSVAVARIGARIGVLPDRTMAALEDAIRLDLAL
ncbi:MAG TPA: type II toxin-antitoxin system PemK/MazF family toxin [Candidatus Limnocylindrales bacterium]